MSARIEPPASNTTTLETLDIVGDGDDLDLIHDLEQAFAVEFADAEVETWCNAGDVRDAVERSLKARAGGDNIRCMNTMAYHALRQTLMSADVCRRGQTSAAAGANRQIPLNARLDRYFSTPNDLAAELKRQTGLSAAFEMGWLGSAGLWLMFAGFVWLLLALIVSVWGQPFTSLTVWIVFALAEIAGFSALRFDGRSYEGCETVADAVAMLTRENFGILAERGGRFNLESIWQTVRQVMARSVCLQPDKIGAKTLLLKKR